MNRITAPISPAELIADSREQIEGVKTAAGLPDVQFNALCLPVLTAYAKQVQGLPLSSTTFSSIRGAWDFGLIAAMVSYRYASTVIYFPDMGAEERRRLEPQCKYMSFVATLATSLAMVTAATKLSCDGDQYHPLTARESLFQWLSANPNATFVWRTGEAQLSAPVCAAIAARFIPVGLLENFDPRVVLMLYDAVVIKTAMNGLESTLGRVVRSSTQAVLEHHATKQSAVFKEPESTLSITKADASSIADKIISVANPTVPVNPLAVPQAAAPAVQPSLVPVPPSISLTPAPAPAPASAEQGRPQTSTVPAATVAQTPAAAMQSNFPSATELPGTAVAPGPIDDPLRNADKVLKEWFAALKMHPRYGALRDHLKVTEEGIEMPINMLGMFGTTGAAIRKMMETANLVIRRSDDARSLIVRPSLTPYLFGETPASSVQTAS
jgi:hypothetical protein